MKNPYRRKNKWYFFDESYGEHGPFRTKNIAKRALERYLFWLG